MDKTFFRAGNCLYNYVMYTFKSYQFSRNYSSLLIVNLKLNSENFLNSGNTGSCPSLKNFHINSNFGLRFEKRDAEDRKSLSARREEGDNIETTFYMDKVKAGFGQLFPDEETPNQLYNGVKFSDLPIVHIKVSRNNTIISVTDAKGVAQLFRSCGMDGFKNAKKGTNVAAQVTAQSLGMKAFDKGIKNVRVCIRGFGPGRMASVKGLTLGGLNVVSISDVSPISFEITPRPRKMRRV